MNPSALACVVQRVGHSVREPHKHCEPHHTACVAHSRSGQLDLKHKFWAISMSSESFDLDMLLVAF